MLGLLILLVLILISIYLAGFGTLKLETQERLRRVATCSISSHHPSYRLCRVLFHHIILVPSTSTAALRRPRSFRRSRKSTYRSVPSPSKEGSHHTVLDFSRT
ncbi:hypothetical protein BJ546DRAFT_1039513 [Cryomyces antarcticus]